MKNLKIITVSFITTVSMSLFLFGCKEKNEDLSIKEEAYYAVNLQNTKPSKEINDGESIIERVLNLKTKNIESINFDIIGAENLDKNIVFQKSYTNLEGVTTFRGNNYRTSPSFGKCDIKEKKLESMWKFTTSSSTWGGGAGWTGQPSIVKWPEELKKSMNIKDEFKEKKDFTEVIYSSLDGNIYFLDLETGKPSRDKIYVGNPIKGTLTIDPRGIPLLYVGEGINERDVVGLNIFSLIDGRKLYELSGWDSNAYRGWPAFDSSPLVHGATDTLIEGGENGILYVMKLNTNYDAKANSISIDPKITKYRYRISGSQGLLGIENSVAIYGNLLYFADNNGYIQCIDLNTMKPIWLFDGGDDTDASITIDVEHNIPYLYTGTEVDIQGSKGVSTLKKINGLTGEAVWSKKMQCESLIGNDPVNGGLLATNIVGKNKLSDRVIFSLARYKGFNRGAVIAVDKKSGGILWETDLDNYMWSSPVDFYDEEGNGYIIQCDSIGNMFLMDGVTGKILDKVNLGSNIESSPAIFNDMVVVATRGGLMCGVKIK